MTFHNAPPGVGSPWFGHGESEVASCLQSMVFLYCWVPDLRVGGLGRLGGHGGHGGFCTFGGHSLHSGQSGGASPLVHDHPPTHAMNNDNVTMSFIRIVGINHILCPCGEALPVLVSTSPVFGKPGTYRNHSVVLDHAFFLWRLNKLPTDFLRWIESTFPRATRSTNRRIGRPPGVPMR